MGCGVGSTVAVGDLQPITNHATQASPIQSQSPFRRDILRGSLLVCCRDWRPDPRRSQDRRQGPTQRPAGHPGQGVAALQEVTEWVRPGALAQSWRQGSPLEQGGVPHRSSRPQQVCPGWRRAELLRMWGVEKSLSVSWLPHSGQTGMADVERTKTSTRPPQFAQWYS